MSHRSYCTHVVIVEFYGNIDWLFGKWNQKNILERFLCSLGFISSDPLLKQGRERVAIDSIAACCRTYDDLPIAGEWNFGQMLAFTIPTRHRYKFIKIYVLLGVVACKYIVESQCAIFEIIGKLLSMNAYCGNQ